MASLINSAGLLYSDHVPHTKNRAARTEPTQRERYLAARRVTANALNDDDRAELLSMIGLSETDLIPPQKED